MSKPRRKFVRTDEEILKAVAPRALPVYAPDELEVRNELAEEGALHTLSRRQGGRSQKDQSSRASIRRLLIEFLYPTLRSDLRKHPTGAATIAHVRETLALNTVPVDSAGRVENWHGKASTTMITW